MASTNYDIITIGGGLGGAALAKVMAEHGASVLVLESETNFKDRIRGEVIMGWGVVDAIDLGIYDCLKAAGGVEVEFAETVQDGGNVARRHLPSTALPGKPRFNMYHPNMQDALLEAASDAGAVVHRGGRVQGINRGDIPTVIVSLDGR